MVKIARSPRKHHGGRHCERTAARCIETTGGLHFGRAVSPRQPTCWQTRTTARCIAMTPNNGAGASRYNSLACARESLDDRRVVRPNTVIEWRLRSRRCIEMTVPPPSSAPFHSACAVPEPARRAEILRAVRKRARSLSLSKRRAPNLSITHQLWQNVVFVSRVLVKKLQICTRIFSRGHGMAHAKTRRTRRRAGFSVGAPPRGRPPPQTRKQTRADTGVCVRDAHDALQNG